MRKCLKRGAEYSMRTFCGFQLYSWIFQLVLFSFLYKMKILAICEFSIKKLNFLALPFLSYKRLNIFLFRHFQAVISRERLSIKIWNLYWNYGLWDRLHSCNQTKHTLPLSSEESSKSLKSVPLILSFFQFFNEIFSEFVISHKTKLIQHKKIYQTVYNKHIQLSMQQFQKSIFLFLRVFGGAA